MDIEELTGKITDAWARYQRANADRTQAALDTGAGLIELRERLPHGDFLPAIEGMGIADRSARDWMRLSRAGLTSATVAHLGGIRAALDSLAKPKSATVAVLTGDDVRRRELESENVELKRQVGDMLVTATPEQLEMLARLVRLQVEVRETREKLNLAITERESLKKERESLRASIAAESA